MSSICEENGSAAALVPFPEQYDYPVLAKEKLEEELKGFSGDNKEKAVSSFVASTLTKFSEESERFAEVVYKTRRTLSDCCEEIMRGCGSSISDIDVYRAAAKFYFPNSEVEFKMEISFTGEGPSAEEMAKAPEKKPAKLRAAKNDAKKQSKPAQKTASAVPAASAPAKQSKPPKKEPETIQLTLFSGGPIC